MVIHLDAQQALGTDGPVFGPMMGCVQRMTDQDTDNQLGLIVGFYGQLEEILAGHVARLRAELPEQ